MFGGDDTHVDTNHAVFQGLADAEDASYIAAVEVAGQAKFGVVGGVNRLLVLVEAKDRWAKCFAPVIRCATLVSRVPPKSAVF